MSNTAPHYLLFSETQNDHSGLAGGWSFVLQRIDMAGRIEVADQEPDVRGERLKLLAVVRGLEALEQPSKVTLITPNRFIGRGIRSGLSSWKENNWQWERFGIMTDIKNSDLWKRVDRAKKIHTIECRVWNFSKFIEHIEQPKSNLDVYDRQPVVKSRQHSKTGNRRLPSWTDMAAIVADKLISFPSTQQAYGCA